MKKLALLRRVDAIQQLLDDLRNDILADDTEEAIEVPGQGTWRLSMIAELKANIQHLPGALALFDLAAEAAPKWVSYSEILERSGLNDRDQRNEHIRLSWVTKRLFSGEKIWPVEWAADGEMSYRMLDVVARWWRES
jgi:hypothetical protein